MQQLSPSEETANLLARLSSRPGVQGTLILSRDTGAIVRSSGLATNEDVSGEENGTASNTVIKTSPDSEVQKKGTRKAEEVAKLVWSFMQHVSTLVEELNGHGDESKLLRLRTKKNELVIVPDAKFLLVVIHSTPPA